MGPETSIEAGQRSAQLKDDARVISDVTRRFAEVTTDYQRLLESIAQSLAESLRDSCVVFLLTPDGTAMTASSVHATDPLALAELRGGLAERRLLLEKQPALQRVLSTGQPLLIPVLAQREDPSDEQQLWQHRLGLHSVLVVPVTVQGQAIGVLTLGRFRPESPPFQHSDQVLAQNLADHAGLAIENARLYTAAEEARRAAERAHEALRRSEAAHRLFFEANPQASFVVDVENLSILAANDAALQLYGYSRDEFMQLNLRTCVTPTTKRA